MVVGKRWRFPQRTLYGTIDLEKQGKNRAERHSPPSLPPQEQLRSPIMDPIAILAVGGTIDKVYFDAKSEYEVGPPNIEKVLGELTLAIDYTVTSLMRKDSLDLSDEDRQTIVTAAAAATSARVLITHGTDTMIRTAQALRQVVGKTIVLTGAMEPALFKTSDAVFNIGCALAAVQALPPGVYIVMNGRIFAEGTVRKNLSLGRFEEIGTDD